MSAAVCAGKYVDAESDPDEVVADLEGLLQHISGLGEALALYNQYLSMFDTAPDDLASLAQAEKEANSRYQVHNSCYCLDLCNHPSITLRLLFCVLLRVKPSS